MKRVEICGIDTSTLPKPSNKEIDEMLRHLKQGNLSLRETLIYNNMRLVLSVVQKFMNKKCNIDDVFQVGCIGLMKAIDNFDVSLNVQFSTYAVPMIVGEIKRYFRDNIGFRITRSMRDTAYKILQFKEGFEKQYKREATTSEISKALEIPEYEVNMAQCSSLDPISLYEPVYNDGNETVRVLDQIGDTKNNSDSWLENITLLEALKKLNGREKEILLMRYYYGKTQTEISEEVGISQAQVSRLEKNAIAYMKKKISY